MPVHNNGAKMNVVSFTRLDKIALELPPNDPSTFGPDLPNFKQGLGGRTAPAAGQASMLPPQNMPAIDGVGPFGFAHFAHDEGDVPRKFVLGSAGPPDRQDYTNDGGSITATPPPSVTQQENQKGVMDIMGDADMAVLKEKGFFKPGQYEDEGK